MCLAYNRSQVVRSKNRNYRVQKIQYPTPEPHCRHIVYGEDFYCTDMEDVIFIRKYRANNNHQNPAVCSCWMCGNPRTFYKDGRTLQEKRSDLDFEEHMLNIYHDEPN